MADLLKSIPGPQFLIFFPLLVFVILAVARFVMKNMHYADSTLPEPSRFDPAAIAALRGGWKLVLKTVIFSLWRQGVVEIIPDEREREINFLGMKINLGTRLKAAFLIKRAEGSVPPVDRVERAVYSFLKSEKCPADFFRDSTLKSFVETYCQSMRGEFEKLQLLRGVTERKFVWFITLVVLVLIYSIGVTRYFSGIENHRPVGFLVFMLVAALPVVLTVLRPWEKVTATGRGYIQRLEEHFGWLKSEMGKREKPGIDPAYAFAIFGTAAVAGTLLYAPFGEAFPSRQSSGCGGGSCGGSSCSGGSCGGGGCGGCGGGD
jgi:uncharacterized protein (TIGR04222 family)